MVIPGHFSAAGGPAIAGRAIGGVMALFAAVSPSCRERRLGRMSRWWSEYLLS